MISLVTDLRTDGRSHPRGIGSRRPEFSWRLAPGSGHQTAWEIEVAADEASSYDPVLWASGRVNGSAPFGIRYEGADLTSAKTYRWRVRVWADADDSPSSWETSTFETGILPGDDWSALWSAGPVRGKNDPPTALYLHGAASLESPVIRARAYVSSLGWHRFLVNGTDLTGPALVPRWTALDHEVEYVTYDVTAALTTGTNTIGLVVGDGRFRGSNGYENHSRIYGDRLAGVIQILADLEDGTEHLIVTDSSWFAGTGRIRESDPKFGERADLRIDESWAASPTPPAGFEPVEVLSHPRTLIAESVERVREVGRLRPVSIVRVENGDQVVDFGQNFAGVVRLRLPAAAGTEIVLTHSEVLQKDGTLDLDYIHLSPFGRWYQRDSVILGDVETEWQPWFTIHGFRYVQIRGLVDDLTPEDIHGIVISTDLDWTGEFTSSDPRLDRLWSNVSWSVRSNFMDTSTDCPTRERSGWTGDIQVFAPTATNMVNAQWYLRRFLHNLAIEQAPDGSIPVVIPSGFSAFSGGPRGHLARAGTAAGWSDASVLVPWTLYQRYGDERVLADQYESMVAWVDSCARRAREASKRKGSRVVPEVDEFIVDTGFQFGEWLRPGEGPVLSSIDAARRGAVVATAYLEHSARVLSQIARVLGKDADQTRYLALANDVRRAWRTRFLGTNGRIGTDRQDDYVRAIAFDLLEGAEVSAAAQRLVGLIEKSGGLGTGFLSTPLLLDTLVDTGHADIAWRLLLSTTSPSWLHQVNRGATTVWETWEGYTKSGKAKMSHNHFALGSVARFLTERIAGITPLDPGYRTIGIRPLVGGGLTAARAVLQTPYGPLDSSWRMLGDGVEYVVSIPPGSTGRFCAHSDNESVTLTPGIHTLRRTKSPDNEVSRTGGSGRPVAVVND